MCVYVRAVACACVCVLTKMQWRPAHPGLLRWCTPLPLPTAATPSAPALRPPSSSRPHFPRKRTSSEFAFYFRACNAIGRTKRLRRTDCAGRRDKGERGEGESAPHGRLYIPIHMRMYVRLCLCMCVHTYVQSFGCFILFFTLFCFVFCLLILHFMNFLRFFSAFCACTCVCVCVCIYLLNEHKHIHTHEEAAMSVAVDFNVNAILGLPTVRPTVRH